jgi:hypothetical protein
MVEVGVGQLAACVEKVDKAVCEESSALRAGTATIWIKSSSAAVHDCTFDGTQRHEK